MHEILSCDAWLFKWLENRPPNQPLRSLLPDTLLRFRKLFNATIPIIGDPAVNSKLLMTALVISLSRRMRCPIWRQALDTTLLFFSLFDDYEKVVSLEELFRSIGIFAALYSYYHEPVLVEITKLMDEPPRPRRNYVAKPLSSDALASKFYNALGHVALDQLPAREKKAAKSIQASPVNLDDTGNRLLRDLPNRSFMQLVYGSDYNIYLETTRIMQWLWERDRSSLSQIVIWYIRESIQEVMGLWGENEPDLNPKCQVLVDTAEQSPMEEVLIVALSLICKFYIAKSTQKASKYFSLLSIAKNNSMTEFILACIDDIELFRVDVICLYAPGLLFYDEQSVMILDYRRDAESFSRMFARQRPSLKDLFVRFSTSWPNKDCAASLPHIFRFVSLAYLHLEVGFRTISCYEAIIERVETISGLTSSPIHPEILDEWWRILTDMPIFPDDLDIVRVSQNITYALPATQDFKTLRHVVAKILTYRDPVVWSKASQLRSHVKSSVKGEPSNEPFFSASYQKVCDWHAQVMQINEATRIWHRNICDLLQEITSSYYSESHST